MIRLSYILIGISIILFSQCLTHKVAEQTYQDVTQLEDSIKIGDGNLTIYNVYKPQVRSLHNGETQTTDENSNVLLSNLYKPYRMMWEGYVGDEAKFLKWHREKLNVGKLNRQASMASKADIDGLIKNAAEKMSTMTNRQPAGKWYIVFGPSWTDLGGIGNGNMVIDLGNKLVDKERITLALAHELNHQIYGHTSSTDPQRESVLFRCVDEGFATYINQLYLGDKSAAENLLYSESDFQWCLENEKELFKEAKKYFSSTERKDKELLASRSQKLVKGGPGAQGYFIGYRICEEYVKKNGPDSWKKIYDIPVSELLKVSGL